MKAKTHIFLTLCTMLIFISSAWNYITSDLNIDLSIIGFSIVIIIVGSLLPDADSNDRGSKIFYTIFRPIGILINKLEGKFAKLLKKETGHRKVLHHPLGILLSTLIVTIIFTALSFIFMFNITLAVVVYYFFIILNSQLLHLLQDSTEKFSVYLLWILILIFIFVWTLFGYVRLKIDYLPIDLQWLIMFITLSILIIIINWIFVKIND